MNNKQLSYGLASFAGGIILLEISTRYNLYLRNKIITKNKEILSDIISASGFFFILFGCYKIYASNKN